MVSPFRMETPKPLKRAAYTVVGVSNAIKWRGCLMSYVSHVFSREQQQIPILSGINKELERGSARGIFSIIGEKFSQAKDSRVGREESIDALILGRDTFRHSPESLPICPIHSSPPFS